MYVLEKADDQKFELNAGSRPYLIQIFDHRPSQVRKSPLQLHHRNKVYRAVALLLKSVLHDLLVGEISHIIQRENDES